MALRDAAFSPRCPPVSDWPPRHRQAWQAAFKPRALFEAPSAASRWRPHSVEKTMAGYGAWIHWLRSHHHGDLAAIEASGPGDFVTRDNVLAYVEQLRSINSSMTIFWRAQELYDALRAMTPSMPKGHWDWLKNAFKNLRSDAEPSRNKLARLKEADELEGLGLRLMAEAEASAARRHLKTSGVTALQRARAYRDGLMIALLIRRPFRIKNFYSLSIGDNLLIDGDTVGFAFTAAQMKGKRAIEVPFPAHLLPHLRRYIEHYRPILATISRKARGFPTNALWISQDGTALSEGALHVAIRKRTAAEFGLPIPPHWFRDSVVTTLVRDAPASALIIGTILGHATPDIANKHYNQSLMIDSTRQHTALIEDMIAAANSERLSP